MASPDVDELSMATKSGLIRSFYSWMARTESEMPPSRSLPLNHPTSLKGVTRVAQQVKETLKNSPFEERAIYWAELFDRIQREGWKGENRLEDSVQESIWQELNDGHLAL